MAEAIINGVISGGLAKPEDISVGEILEDRCRYLTNKYRIYATPNNSTVINKGDFVILCIKPQNLKDIGSVLASSLSSNQTVISIMAGVRMSTLMASLNHSRLIRVMPNTPAQIGAGMTLWQCSPNVDSDVADQTQSILKTMGDEIRVEEEQYIDMATALSASGPAYVFTFIESLIDAGVYIGLSREMASRLTLQTVLGSARLVLESTSHPAELRNRVTSPGGTTSEALLALEEGSFRSTIMNAVVAAYEKSMSFVDEGTRSQ